ncbi:MAG: serine/threonine-protein phosphatase [Lentisphaerae bacterium]|nr:serine/threonine-protein phosphatase [Lentisphaerota bacterium]
MAFLHLRSYAITDIGKKRSCNEDSVLALPGFGLFCVADGMGGLKSGDLASKCITDFLRDVFETALRDERRDLESLVRTALERANCFLLDFARKNNISGAGSTAVVLTFDPDDRSRAEVFHAGDSRAYRLRSDKIEQLTADHSVASIFNLRDTASLSPFFRSLITNAIGLDATVELDHSSVDVQTNDLFLLCSDGLTKMLKDDTIMGIVNDTNNDSLSESAHALVDAANDAGGADNIGVVLVEVS